MREQRLVIFLAFANEEVGSRGYLRNLHREQSLLTQLWQPLINSGKCEVIALPSVTPPQIFDTFSNDLYRGRIAIFHYGGHADGDSLFLEDERGKSTPTYASGLAAFLGRQPGLQLVFLNGCSTQPQVERLQEMGVPVVIATSQAIDDEVAMIFASRFYSGLTQNLALREAFDSAQQYMDSLHGQNLARLYRNIYNPDALPRPIVDRRPWDMYVRRGAEQVNQWNLPSALGDPLMALPPTPASIALPPEPFRHILWFRREDAPIFFGRGQDIFDLYQLVRANGGDPILLLHGQSGVGKSSLLAAGLQPRLEAEYQVVYRRRDPTLGLASDLDAVLQRQVGQDILAAWRTQEQAQGKPLVVILDQVEEIFTRVNANTIYETEVFLERLVTIFDNPSQRPQGKLILSLRKEWLAEVEKLLRAHNLPYNDHFLDRLTRNGIIEAVTGPSRPGPLQTRYKLQVASGLPEQIADDLLTDAGSALAPTLQILLTKLWEKARQVFQARPIFSLDLYIALQRQGWLLEDFLREQLEILAQQRGDAVRSGLVLELLYFHTTSLGTAAQRRHFALLEEYEDKQQEIIDLITACRDLYLLVEATQLDASDPLPATQLAHDTLTPLVRALYSTSTASGPRARRILEGRVGTPDHPIMNPLPFDEVDLAQVEAGKAGMRTWRRDEKTLVERSREERDRREREKLQRRQLIRRGTIAIAMLAIVALCLAGLAYWQRENAIHSEATAVAESNRANEEAQHAKEAAATADIARKDAEMARATSEAETIIANVAEQKAVKAERDAEEQATKATAQEHVARRQLATSLAYQSNILGNEFLALGLLLAREAVLTTQHSEGILVPAAHQTLMSRLSQPLGIPSATLDTYPTTQVTSPDNQWLAEGAVDIPVLLWNTMEPTARPIPLTDNIDYLTAQVFSPDSTWFAMGRRDGSIHLWNMTDATADPFVLTGHTDGVWLLTFSLDSQWLATSSFDGSVRLWSLTDLNAAPIVLPGSTDQVRILFFSPDSAWIVAILGNGTLRFWATQEPMAYPHVFTGYTGDISFLVPNSESGWPIHDAGHDSLLLPPVASTPAPTPQPNSFTYPATPVFSLHKRWRVEGASDGTIYLWDMAEPENLPILLSGYIGLVWTFAFSPDNHWLAIGGLDGTVRLWNLENLSDEPIVRHEHSALVRYLDFSHDSQWLATGSWDGSVRLWDIKNLNTDPIVHHGYTDWRYKFFFTADDDFFVLSNFDSSFVREWDLSKSTTSPLPLITHANRVWNLGYGPERNWLAASDRGRTIDLLDVAAPNTEPISYSGYTGTLDSLAFSPNNQWLAAADSEDVVYVWDMARPTSAPKPFTNHTAKVGVLAFSSDAKFLASGSEDTTIQLWDPADPLSEPMVLRGHLKEVVSLAFSQDNHWLASGSDDSTVRLWDMTDLEAESMILTTSTDQASNLSFSPNSHWLVAIALEGTVRLWDMTEPSAEPIILADKEDTINVMSFDSDGGLIAGGGTDGVIQLWDLSDPRHEPQIIERNFKNINALAFSPNGFLLAAGNLEGTVRVWDMTDLTVNPLVLHASSAAVRSIHFSPDGTFLAYISEDQSVYLWNMNVDYLMELACQYSGRNFTWDEWNTYFREEPYHQTCENWPIHPSVPQEEFLGIFSALSLMY